MSADVLKGKSVLITGANSGIGFVAAEALAGMGAHVILACRRQPAAEEAMRKIRTEHPDASLEFLSLDLASLEKVRAAAAELKKRHQKLDILINNAGLASVRRERTEDGFEKTFGTNHLGPFLFTNLILPLVEASRGRIINVASDAHRAGRMHWDDLQLKKKRYFVMRAYCQSKLANILFTRALARRCAGRGVHVNCLHPGAVSTAIWPEDHWYERLFTRVLRLFLVSPEEGARTTIWLASSETGGRATGRYFVRCRERTPAKHARSDEAAERLWHISEQLTGLTG